MSGSQHMDGSSMSSLMNKDSSTAATSSSASNGNSGKSSSTESAEGEEQEDSSSNLSPSTDNNINNTEDELASFRTKWQEELKITKDNERMKKLLEEREKKVDLEDENDENEMLEEQAKRWFLQGVENEKTGKLYEAIICYKKAVQLVPDIEFRLYEPQRQKAKELSQLEESSEITEEGKDNCDSSLMDEEVEDEDDHKDIDLVMKLQRLFSKSKSICEMEVEQKSTHISALPMEIILYIFRWVVSYDLDLRSLEMCSMVCRGFYLCSRDSEIWRVACLKVWGVHCGGLTNFNNWRMMYLGRPRLNFNGCYISKTTYIRHGENSFQDQFYRPWHVVEYFRYLRFFPEGTVLMLTTPDQPVPVLNLLKRREARNPSILTGHYRLHDDKVAIVLHRQDLLNNNRYRGRRNNISVEMVEQTFHIELEVLTLKNRLNNQLVWRKYTVISKRGNSDTKTHFDVSSNKFPPFWFSRVKSYTAESDRPL